MTLIVPLLIVIAVGLMLAGAALTGPRLFPAARSTTRHFRCPFQDRDVSVEFQESDWENRLVDVTRCTYFTPSTAVDCHKGCLLLKGFPPVLTRAAVA